MPCCLKHSLQLRHAIAATAASTIPKIDSDLTHDGILPMHDVPPNPLGPAEARSVNVTLASVPITVLDKQGFSSFVQEMVESERVGFGVSGLVDAEIRLPFGSVTPKGLTIHHAS